MQKEAPRHQLVMSTYTQSRLFHLLLMFLTWGLPHVALALGRPTPPDSCWQPGFGVPEGTNGEVLAMVWARGNLYIGGKFTAVGGVAARNLARWDGRHWHSLGTGGNNGVGEAYRYTNYSTGQQYQSTVAVHALAVGSNGDLYVGGEFENSSPMLAHNLARWDGHAWHTVGSGLNGPVQALAYASVNRLLVGGSFTTFGDNSAAASHFAVLDPAACPPISKSTVRGSRLGAKRVPARRPRPAHK